MADNNIRANCKISTPIFYTDEQVVSFNGFAWSNARGIVLENVQVNQNNIDWQQWLGTQP